MKLMKGMMMLTVATLIFSASSFACNCNNAQTNIQPTCGKTQSCGQNGSCTSEGICTNSGCTGKTNGTCTGNQKTVKVHKGTFHRAGK